MCIPLQMYWDDANEDVCPLSTPQPVRTHPEHFPAREDSNKREYLAFISQMNDNSTTAAYHHVPYACRQREIRTPFAAELHAWIAITSIPVAPKPSYHGSQPLYIVISCPKFPRLELVGYNPLLHRLGQSLPYTGPEAESVSVHAQTRGQIQVQTNLCAPTQRHTNLLTNSTYFTAHFPPCPPSPCLHTGMSKSIVHMYCMLFTANTHTPTHTGRNIQQSSSTVWASTPQCVPAASVRRHVIMEGVSNCAVKQKMYERGY